MPGSHGIGRSSGGLAPFFAGAPEKIDFEAKFP
jgi:hypothetical protein